LAIPPEDVGRPSRSLAAISDFLTATGIVGSKRTSKHAARKRTETAWRISAAPIPPKTFRDPIKKILELLFPTAVVWY
jgi:hypothetical protein